MYFAYGWPRVLSAVDGAGKEETVFLSIEGELALLVSTCCIQIWSGGQHRVKLGRHTRAEASVQAEGLNKRAYWCPSRRLLAVLVRRKWHFQCKIVSLSSTARVCSVLSHPRFMCVAYSSCSCPS